MSRYNFFEVVTVDGYDFPGDPQVTFGFHSTSITFLNRSSSILEYSFDGETLHGDLNPGDASNGLVFDNRVESTVWFRGSDGYGDVRIEAWGMSGR
jgi:hypothetical protein